MANFIDRIKYSIAKAILETITEPIITVVNKKTEPLTSLKKDYKSSLELIKNMDRKINNLQAKVNELSENTNNKNDEVYLLVTKEGDYLPYAYTDKLAAIKNLKKAKAEINENTTLLTLKVK